MKPLTEVVFPLDSGSGPPLLGRSPAVTASGSLILRPARYQNHRCAGLTIAQQGRSLALASSGSSIILKCLWLVLFVSIPLFGKCALAQAPAVPVEVVMRGVMDYATYQQLAGTLRRLPAVSGLKRTESRRGFHQLRGVTTASLDGLLAELQGTLPPMWQVKGKATSAGNLMLELSRNLAVVTPSGDPAKEIVQVK